MSEIPPQPESSQAQQPAKPMSPTLRMVILGGIAVVLLAIVGLAGSIRTAQARSEAHIQGFSGIAYASKETVLVKDRDKLRVLAEGIAEAAGYDSVTFTDEAGVVLASTDATNLGKTIEHLKKPPLKTELHTIDGHETLYRAVTLGGSNVVGGISARLEP